MLLAKSCQKRFHIKNGTIKLGTLHGYRIIENEELIDKHEGMLTFYLNFRGRVRIQTQWFNTINGNGISFGGPPPILFPGRTRTHFEKLHVEQNFGPWMVLLESRGVVSREAPNGFIFCMSRVERKEDCVGIFKGCNDYWYITEEKVHDFARQLVYLLRCYLMEQHAKGDYILPPETDMSDPMVHCEYGEVNYISREIDLYGEDFMPLEEYMGKMRDMAFTKPESYSKEREYRFSFVVVVGGKLVEPVVSSVFLDSTSLMELVF